MESPFNNKQHLCKCGGKDFYLILELLFDAQGSFNHKDG
jgi:hypothetical protein